MAPHGRESDRPKIVVVMPAYNAAKTLKITYDAIPQQAVHQVILVDDGSTDKTLEIARELLVQAAHLGFRIKEVPVPTKYFPEASQASFVDSVVYGLSILYLLSRFLIHRISLVEFRQFQPFQSRYSRVE